jgi:hypothetical protein
VRLQLLTDNPDDAGIVRANGRQLGQQSAQKVTAARVRQRLRQLGNQMEFLG